MLSEESPPLFLLRSEIYFFSFEGNRRRPLFRVPYGLFPHTGEGAAAAGFLLSTEENSEWQLPPLPSFFLHLTPVSVSAVPFPVLRRRRPKGGEINNKNFLYVKHPVAARSHVLRVWRRLFCLGAQASKANRSLCKITILDSPSF